MKKEEADKIYKELRKKYSDEEIAESCIFSIDPTEEEKEEISRYFRNRKKSLLNTKKKEKLNNLNMKDIKSPCIGVCKYNQNFVCVGCKRSIEEIKKWSSITNSEKEKILKKIKTRKV